MRLAFGEALALTGVILTFTACATMRPPRPPSLDLPKPPSDLRAVRKGGNVKLTWTVPSLTTDRQAIHTLGPTRICRGTEPKLEQCGTPVGEAERAATSSKPGQKVSASYTDLLPAQIQSDTPLSLISYAVEVLNVDGHSAGLSNQVRVPAIHALRAPKDFAAQVTSQGVQLTWSGLTTSAQPPSTAPFVYRVYRRLEGSQDQVLVNESAGGKESFTVTDSNFEWEKTYQYHVETVIISSPGQAQTEVAGDDSPEVKVFADDVFPPAVPSGLQAVFSGLGQQPFIDVIWAPDTDVDLDGYNVYRREEGGAPIKLNTELVKTPAYRDANVVSGKSYSYSVSAVDLRRNESSRSEEASERVP